MQRQTSAGKVGEHRTVEGKRVLVVEDEPDIGQLLIMHLTDMGVDARLCSDGELALRLLLSEYWDLVLLDLRLPGIDGVEVCRRLRAEGIAVPILMLTAKTSELDRVMGLEIGADDYITKPFSVMEVMARVRATVRRVDLERRQVSETSVVTTGNIRIDEARREVTVAAQPVSLTAKEFDLLLFFAQSPGQVFRRVHLLDQVWGFGYAGYEHTVNSHINRLRSKLQKADPANDYIVTVWGVGYKFNDAPAATDQNSLSAEEDHVA